MKIHRYLAVLCCLFVLPLLLTSFIVGKDTKKKVKGDVCSASNPPARADPQQQLSARLLSLVRGNLTESFQSR